MPWSGNPGFRSRIINTRGTDAVGRAESSARNDSARPDRAMLEKTDLRGQVYPNNLRGLLQPRRQASGPHTPPFIDVKNANEDRTLRHMDVWVGVGTNPHRPDRGSDVHCRHTERNRS